MFKRTVKRALIAAGVLLLAMVVWALVAYRADISRERQRIAHGSQIAETPCGPIEYAVAGSGRPVLVVHGAGGGFDQGLDIARSFIGRGVQVIAVSRFGYLRTPLPEDASAAAQADAHACLLDALGIRRAGVIGVSAGGPSAMQFAIRHPDRTDALFLLVPAAYHPDPAGVSVATPRWTPALFDTALRSDFIFWLAIRAIPGTMTEAILGTPAAVAREAEEADRKRVQEMMTHILPVSPRRLGLLNDARVVSTLQRYDLERIHAPTLVVSLKDDGYGTYEGAQYSAGQIAGARFIGYESGGHLCVGHTEEIAREAVRLFMEAETE